MNKYKILVVDDDEDLRENMMRLLDFYFPGQIISACEGNDALSVLELNHIDFVITDMNMPNGMSGKDLIQKIKANPRLRHVKIIAISGDFTNFEKDIVGSNYSFEKPISTKSIINIINKESNQ